MVTDYLSEFAALLPGFKELVPPNLRIHPLNLTGFVLVGVLLYAWKWRKTAGPGSGFWRWLFPRDVYLHPSHIVDLKIFIFGRLLAVTKVLNGVVLITFFAMLGMFLVSKVTGEPMIKKDLDAGGLIAATLIITLVTDFFVYWVHRLHHERMVLWPFHAVHHSAEVMTPVTSYRKHPVYDFISGVVAAVPAGFAQGVLLGLLVGGREVLLIGGVNAAYFTFNLLIANFRHSHIWISYGRALEHIFISPAQHQIHHSLRPEHHNKNFGEIFAIWDWMFGTLFIPEREEVLEFGIARPDGSGQRIRQPHPTFRAAMIRPFQDSYKVFLKTRAKKQGGLQAGAAATAIIPERGKQNS